ncbi:hypothetical protein ABG768_005627, partial [Culter alburnus]
MAFGWQLKGAIVALLVLKLPTMPFGQANVNKKRPLTKVEESKSECEREKKAQVSHFKTAILRQTNFPISERKRARDENKSKNYKNCKRQKRRQK